MKKKESAEDPLSVVRHDLRCELMVIREGISQILDGVAEQDWDKCREILSVALKCADRMDKKIMDLRQPSGL